MPMQTAPIKLPKLLTLIKSGKFEIPQFQRSFVWKDNQVKLLIDSIAKGYPIGSFLLMNKDEELELKSRSIEAVIQEENLVNIEDIDIESKESQYILDGQQRMTSIARIFTDGDANKSYYFDLHTLATKDWAEELKWIVSRKRPANGSKERLNNNRLIRSDVILSREKSDIYISEYIEDGEDFKDIGKKEQRKISANIKGIFESIRNYDFSLITIDASQGLESICRVFETINSTGTRLTTFDLAVARFYPEPDLRNMLDSSLIKYPILKEFKVEGERFLQVIYILHSHQKNDTQPAPTRSSLLSLPKDIIEQEWEKSALGLSEAYEWARNNGVRPETLAIDYTLVSLAGLLSTFPSIKDDIDINFNSKIKQWFYSRLLSQGNRASNYIIGFDFANLRSFARGSEALDIKTVSLNEQVLLKINRNDNRFKAIQCLMALHSKEDLLTGQSLEEDIEYHHIFPRSLSKTSPLSKTSLDNVLNRIAVSKSTNRKLSDKHPSEYFNNLIQNTSKNGTIGDVQDRLSSLLLPYQIKHQGYLDLFSNDRYSEFLEIRARIVMEKIRDILGNRLDESDRSDD